MKKKLGDIFNLKMDRIQLKKRDQSTKKKKVLTKKRKMRPLRWGKKYMCSKTPRATAESPVSVTSNSSPPPIPGDREDPIPQITNSPEISPPRIPGDREDPMPGTNNSPVISAGPDGGPDRGLFSIFEKSFHHAW